MFCKQGKSGGAHSAEGEPATCSDYVFAFTAIGPLIEPSFERCVAGTKIMNLRAGAAMAQGKVTQFMIGGILCWNQKYSLSCLQNWVASPWMVVLTTMVTTLRYQSSVVREIHSLTMMSLENVSDSIHPLGEQQPSYITV